MIITSLSKHACICKYLSSPSYDLSLFLNCIVQDNDEKSDIGLSVQIPKRKEEGFEKKNRRTSSYTEWQHFDMKLS